MLSKKPVEQYDPETKRLIAEHESVYAAAAAVYKPTAALMTGIIHCCKGRQKTAYGFMWEYKKG